MRRITTISLAAIALLGFFLRLQKINFPSVGYHNMRENEYLGIAQEMGRTRDLGAVRIYFSNAFKEDTATKPYPQPPLVSYQILASWKIFGENLWSARLVNILFGVASIIIIYFIAQALFANILLSLFSAFLLAVMPLAIFFSRNLQPESPAFFFMLLGNLFYLKFINTLKERHLVWGGLSFVLAWLYKFNFLIGIIPVLFCLPFKEIVENATPRQRRILALLAPYVLIPLVIFWLKGLGLWGFAPAHGMGILDILSPAYWNKHGDTILLYAYRENFTPIFCALALLGTLLAFLNSGSLFTRYIIGWAVSLVCYGFFYAQDLFQQNFAQMPFLALVCISCVYIVMFSAGTLSKVFKKGLLPYIIVAVALVSIIPVRSAIRQLYATVFLGEDVAGSSLKELTAPSERVFLLTHSQGYGIARYARRYVGWPRDLADFKDKENKFKVRYICVYPAGFLGGLAKEVPDTFNYIQENYHIKEIGLLDDSNQLIYLILEKGRGENFEEALQSFSGSRQVRTIYQVTGRYVLFYTVRRETPQQDKG
jgi:4-amino-4-deoxy-L-arabinose transferase-like glycosyltransferase